MVQRACMVAVVEKGGLREGRGRLEGNAAELQALIENSVYRAVADPARHTFRLVLDAGRPDTIGRV